MRNLKKILSLVLALMMVLSLMATASATDFVDDADITYKEAVEVMAGLGVLNGVKNADGTYNFQPKNPLNRAAGAKIVAYIANGGALDKDLMATLANPFTDVAGWAVDSVKYCYSQGIINGISADKFDPTNSLDGYAFGKMMLEAAGYDWQSANGSNWKTKVVSTLKANGLLTGIETLSFPAPMTREQACQMAWNIMKSSPEGNVYTVTIGTLTYTFNTANEAAIFAKQMSLDPATAISVVATSSLFSEKFNGKTATGAVVSNGSIVNGQKFTTVGSTNYAVETGAADLGHVVKVYYKDATYDATKGYEVYGVTDLSTEIVVAKAVSAGTGSTAKVAKIFGTVAAVDSTIHNSVSATGTVTSSISAVTFGTGTSDGAAAAGTYVIYGGKVVGYRADSTSDVVVVTVTVTDADKGLYKVGNAGDDDAYVLNGATASSNYDYVVSAEKIDWLGMVPANASSVSVPFVVSQYGQNYLISAVETVTGKVTKINSTKVGVDGKEYTIAVDATAAAAITGASTDFTSGTLNFEDDFTFYLDEAGKVFANLKVTDKAPTLNYELVYVLGAKENTASTDVYGNKTYAYAIQYYTTDGLVNTAANLVSYNGNTIIYSGDTAGTGEVAFVSGNYTGWMLMAETEDGLAVKDLDGGYTAGTVSVSGSDLVLNATSAKLGVNLISKNSVFLYSAATAMGAANKDAAAYTGAHSSTIAAGTNVQVVLKANASNASMSDLVAAYVPAAHSGVSVSTNNVVYVVAYEGQTGKDAYAYTVVGLDGTVKSITVAAKNDSAVSAFCTVNKNASGADVLGLVPTSPDASALDTGDFSKAFNSPAASSYYVVDGVEYYGNDVVTGAKVVDLRNAVLAGTEDPITSVKGMLDETLTATAIFSTTSGVTTISLVIITA